MSGGENSVIYDKDFLRDVRKLPVTEQQKFIALLATLEEDFFHPLLHTKSLSPPLQGMFTFWITRDYRVGFKFFALHKVQLLAADKRDRASTQELKRRDSGADKALGITEEP